MKNKIVYSLVFLLLGVSNNITAQSVNLNLIYELQNELFPKDTSKIFLYEFLSINYNPSGKRCGNEKIDSTLKIRKIQPNKVVVQRLLKSIIMSKDSNAFDPILALYSNHMENYKKEWEATDNNNLYPCETVTDQFDILKSFEVCLKGLYFKKNKYDSKQIFDFTYNKFVLDMNFIKDIENRSSFYQKYLIFNEDFRRIQKKAWFRGNSGFSSLDPYIEELEPYFIETIYKSSKIYDTKDQIFSFLLHNSYVTAPCKV